MVYRKYIRRGGKIYGPYKYHSRKVDGRVTTDYLGKDVKKKNKTLIFFIIGLIAVSFIIFLMNYKSMTGFGIFNGDEQEQVTDSLAFIRLIIELEDAEHLDSSKKFISNIYNEVKALDDVWSETISSGDYVRLFFEDNLTSENDIKIYPRIISGNPSIEVYEADESELIAEFNDIISNQYNKAYLTNLQGSQDVFDLLVLGGSLEIDHIIDPTQELFEDCSSGASIADQWSVSGSGDSVWEYRGDGTCWSENAISEMFTTNAIDLTGYDYASLSFTWTCSTTEEGDGIAVYVNSSSETGAGINVFPINFGAGASEMYNLSAEGLSMTTGVQIRVTFVSDKNNEYCTIDSVNVTGYAPVDTTYPTFSGYEDTPSNNTVYPAGSTTYEFNVTVADTNGTVGLDFNGFNYTATNYSSSPTLFNVTFVKDLEAKTHSYYWWARGSGFNNNFNASLNRSYVIANATPEGSLTNDTALTRDWNGAVTSVGYSESKTGDDDVVYKIFKNGVDVGTPPDKEGAAGTYNYVLNTTGVGGQNYTSNASMDTFTLQIDQIASEVNLTLDYNQTNITIFTGTTIDLNCSTITGESSAYLSLYRDESLINNGTSPIGNRTTFSSVDVINFTCFYNSQNYSTSSDTWWLNVTQAPDLISPNVTINTPASQNYSTNSITFNITAIDDIGLGNCSYSLSNGVTNYSLSNASDAPQDWFGTNSTMMQGWINANFSCNDTSGNQNNTESVRFFIDSIYPEINITTPQNNSNLADNTIDVEYVYTEDNCDSVWYSNDTYSVNTTLTCGNNITDVTWSDAQHNVTIWINDTVNNVNSSSITFTIDTTYPIINITTPQNNSNLADNTIDVEYVYTEDNCDSVWYSNGTYSVNTTLTCGNNITDVTWSDAQHNVTIWINDTVNNVNSSSITFTIDTKIPIFSSYTETPAEGSTYSSGAVYEFNATVTNTNGTVSLEFDGVNYTATNLVGSVYNVTIKDLQVKNHSYYWWGYGSGPNTIFNSSSNYSYMLNNATPEGQLTNDTALTRNYDGTPTTINYSESNTGDDDVEYKIYKNGVDVGTPPDKEGAAGTYNYVLNTTGGGNYSANASMDTFTLTINKITSEVNLTLDYNQSNITIPVGSTIDLNCSTITGESSAYLAMYRDGSLTNNGTSPIGNRTTFSSVEVINFTCFYQSTQNYSTSSDTWWLNVTGVSDSIPPNVTSLTETPTDSPIYFPTTTYEFNATIIDDTGIDIVLLEFDGVNYTATNLSADVYNISLIGLSAETYNYRWSVNDTNNNINNTETGSYTITKAPTNTTLTTVPITPIEYPAVSNFSCRNNESLTTILYINEIDKTTEEDVELIRKAGTYNVSCIATANTNYSSSSDEEANYIISKNNSLVLGLTATTPITYPTATNFVGSGCPSELTCTLNISNQIYEAGTISANYSTLGNENYTSASVTFTVTIDPGIPEGSLTSSNGWAIDYADSTTIGVSETNGGDDDVNYDVFRDGINVGEGSINLSVGDYDYVLNTTGGTNWTANASMDTETLTISQIASSLNLTLDYNQTNISIPVSYTIDLNCSRIAGDPGATLRLYNDGSLINEDTSSKVGNTTTFSTIGTFNITCIYIETTNFTQSSEEWWVEVNDTLNPGINITYPINNTNHSSNTIPINYTYSDDVAISTCWYSNDTFTTNTTLTCGDNITITWAEGEHDVIIWVNDTSNNINSSRINFTIDTTPPYFTTIANQTIPETNSLSYDIDASDDIMGVECFGVNDTTNFQITCAGVLTNKTGLSVQLYNINISVNDTLGNLNSSLMWINVTAIDNTQPNIVIAYPQNTTYGVNVSELNYTATDDVSLDRCWYSTNEGVTNSTTRVCNTNFTDVTSIEGSNTWIVYANDTSGNENSTSVTFFKDTIFPEVNITFPQNLTNTTNNQLNINYTYNDTNVDSCWYSNDTFTTNTTLTCGDNITITWAEGEHDVIIYINDTSNNINSSRINFTIDTTPPYFTTIANQTIQETNSLSYDIDASDDATGVECFSVNDTTNFEITCAGVLTNKTGLSVQLYNINISVNDTLGNLNSSLMWINVTYVDNIAPNITIAYPQNISYSVNVSELNYTATDDVSLSRCWYSTNEGVTNSTTRVCNTNFTDVTSIEGSNTWIVYANDTSGNENSTSVTFFKDSLFPEINITTPTNNTNSSDNTLDVNYTYIEASPDRCWWSNDSGVTNYSLGPCNLNVNITNQTWKEGYNNATVYINDTIGNENSTNVVFFVDTIYPEINITFPQNNTNQSSNTIDVNYTYAETNPDRCWWSNDSGVTNYSLGPCNLNVNITNQTWKEGYNNATVYANDTSGNENLSSVTFFVDSINPDIEFVSPTTTGGNHTQNYIKANVTANDTEIDSITIFLYNSTDLVNSSTNSTSPYFIQFVNLAGGTYYLNASANDTLGNENYTETRTIFLNVSAPSLTIIKPKNETYFENHTLKVHINTNADNSWYNLDNTENFSLEGQTYFNTTEGSHTVYVFANNSFGVTAENVTFNIDDSLFEIYSNNFTGNSTNFNEFSFEEIQNLSGVILENPEFGKIHFNEIINLTDDETPNDNQSDLDENINISFNRIELNSTALPNYNKGATLTLYNLTFTNPRILRDGAVCPSTICTEISYSARTLVFNVTGFTIYSAEQTPGEGTPETPERRGGGGGWFFKRCSKNSDCEEDEVCLDSKCVKLFDIKIIDFESPVKLGEFFEFTYLVKGMANVSGDVEVNFWIEKEKEIITSGLDTIYFGAYEEKIETTKIFLPSNIDSGVYQFFIQVNHRDYGVQSYRTIEIEVKGKIAEITPVGKFKTAYFYYLWGVLLAILIILILIRIYKKDKWWRAIRDLKERREIKEEIKLKKRKIDFSGFYKKLNKKIKSFIKNLINFLRLFRREKIYKPKKRKILEPLEPSLGIKRPPRIKEIKPQELPKEEPEKKTVEQVIEEIKKASPEFPAKEDEEESFDIIEDIVKKEKEEREKD